MRGQTISLVSALVCAAMAAGCATGGQNALPLSGTPLLPIAQAGRSAHGARPAAKPIVGVFVSQGGGPLLEYSYTGQGQPLCTSSITNVPGHIQSDPKYQLLVPQGNGTQGTLAIYDEGKTGHQCLPAQPFGTLSDPYGEPNDASSPDGRTFYIANYAYKPNVAVCKFGRRPGCHKRLLPPQSYKGAPSAGFVDSVTADASGVYGEAAYSSILGNFSEIVYWQGGQGTGTVVATPYDGYFGSIMLDGFGNLLAVDGDGLDVWSGCPAACVFAGQFTLNYPAYSGSLRGTTFMTINDNQTIDVYEYNGTFGITYLNSNGAGLGASAYGIAQR